MRVPGRFEAAEIGGGTLADGIPAPFQYIGKERELAVVETQPEAGGDYFAKTLHVDRIGRRRHAFSAACSVRHTDSGTMRAVCRTRSSSLSSMPTAETRSAFA